MSPIARRMDDGGRSRYFAPGGTSAGGADLGLSIIVRDFCSAKKGCLREAPRRARRSAYVRRAGSLGAGSIPELTRAPCGGREGMGPLARAVPREARAEPDAGFWRTLSLRT